MALYIAAVPCRSSKRLLIGVQLATKPELKTFTVYYESVATFNMWEPFVDCKPIHSCYLKCMLLSEVLVLMVSFGCQRSSPKLNCREQYSLAPKSPW